MPHVYFTCVQLHCKRVCTNVGDLRRSWCINGSALMPFYSRVFGTHYLHSATILGNVPRDDLALKTLKYCTYP